MSGTVEAARDDGPKRSAWRVFIEAAVPLLVMYAGIIVLQGDRIEKDCFCTPDGEWAIWTARVLRDAGLLVVFAFVVTLALFPLRAWCRGDGVPLRERIMEERHHIIAAIVPWTTAILGIVLLTVPSQTADMLAGLQGTGIEGTLIPFGVGAMAWGAAVWFCGRWSIDIELRDPDRRETALAQWNPRLLALITGLAIVIITVKSAGLCWSAAILAMIVVTLLLSFVISRRAILMAWNSAWRPGGRARLEARANLRSAAARLAPEARQAWQPPPGGCLRRTLARVAHFFTRLPCLLRSGVSDFRDDRLAAPGGPVVVWLALVASLTVLANFLYDPQLATFIHAPGTVLLGLGCLTMFATYLSKFFWRLFRVPVLLPLLVITTVLGQQDIGVNHDIRTMNSNRKAAAPTMDQAADAWLSKCGNSLVANGELKVVLVSTAGGASRAALWTFHALSDLEQDGSQAGDLQFPRRVFAISAVSGGALGAAVWSALLAHEDFDCATPITGRDAAIKRREQGHEILTRDFLAPVLAAWIARDVLLGVLPVNPLLRLFHIRLEDRAIALEKSWESAWQARFPDETNNLMAADFTSLVGTSVNRPLLLLNGTVEDTGQPILTAPVAVVDPIGTPYPTFPATYDAAWALGRDSQPLGRDVRTSTAVLNAARFPVVTPQGDMRIARCEDGSVTLDRKCPDGHLPRQDKISVVDGGYFDNIGAGTTVRAVEALRQAFERSGFPARNIKLRIMIVGISSDPDRLITDMDWKWLDPIRSGRDGAWKWLDPLGPQNGEKHEAVDQLMRCGAKYSTLAIGQKGLANTLDAEIAPVLAIVNTQSGHTALRMAELNQYFCAENKLATAPANYVLLSLCPIGNSTKTVSLPLNWVLSPATAAFFKGDDPDLNLNTQCGNHGQLESYWKWAAAP